MLRGLAAGAELTPMLPAVPAQVPLLPAGEDVPLVRTDFSDDAAWDDVVRRVTHQYEWEEPEPLWANVNPVDDKKYEGLTAETLARLVPDGADYSFFVMADAEAMTSPRRPLLVVSVDEDSEGETLRALPAAIVEMEINVNLLANVDWDDFSRQEGVVEARLLDEL